MLPLQFCKMFFITVIWFTTSFYSPPKPAAHPIEKYRTREQFAMA